MPHYEWISPQISAVIVGGTSIPRETAAQPQNKYLRWQSCPLPPPPPHTHTHPSTERGRLIWCEQTSPHTSQFGSPQLARMAGKMSVARLQKSKFRLTEFVRGLTRAGHRYSPRKESAGLQRRVEEGWLLITGGGGRGGAATLKESVRLG